MTIFKNAGLARATRMSAVAGVIALAASGVACSQDNSAAVESTAAESSGVEISPDVFNMYLESRFQRPADQASAEESEAVRRELTDIYLLSQQPQAEALSKEPRLAAQMELQSRAMLAQAVAADYVSRNQATDEELRALYDEQMANAALEFKARHILVNTQGEATTLITELEGGADFAELAQQNSTGPSASSGGDLGWFPPDRMVTEFSTAVQQLQNGEFTKEPVQTQFGWHVILREDSREATPPPFESVSDALKQQIEQQKLQSYLESLR
jgi:peptidyl-prolyl cis-trans isomerase C